MRILHLTTVFPPVIYGGLGTAVGGLVTASARAEMAVRVLLVGETGLGGYGQPISAEQVRADQEEGVADPAGVSIVSVSWYDAQEAGIRLVEQWQPDVVQLHAFWLRPVA